MPPIVPTLTAEQALNHTAMAAVIAETARTHGVPATYLRRGVDPNTPEGQGAVIAVELRLMDDAAMSVGGQRVPSRVVSVGASAMVLRAAVTVPMVRAGELIESFTGVGGDGGVERLIVGDRLVFRGADVGVPAAPTVTLAVRDVRAGVGCWLAEVSGA